MHNKLISKSLQQLLSLLITQYMIQYNSVLLSIYDIAGIPQPFCSSFYDEKHHFILSSGCSQLSGLGA